MSAAGSGAERRAPSADRQSRLGLGGALRHGWIGYRRRLDEELAAAGFSDRSFPDGRVLRICSNSSGVTVAQIGRELGISRQRASKIVAGLRDRGYLALSDSPLDGREKIVVLTKRAGDYLRAHRKAAIQIEAELRAELGNERVDSLYELLGALGDEAEPRPGFVRASTSWAGEADP